MSKLVDSSTDRGQVTGPHIPVVTLTVVVLVVIVGAQVMAAVPSGESDIGPEICEGKFGEGSEWINDSDDELDCRTPNGTLVEDVPINLTSRVS